MSFRMQAHAPTTRTMIHVVHQAPAKEIPEYESDHEVDLEQQRAYVAQMAEYDMTRQAISANAAAVRLGLDAPPSYAEMTDAKLFPPGPSEHKEEHSEHSEHSEPTFRLRRKIQKK